MHSRSLIIKLEGSIAFLLCLCYLWSTAWSSSSIIIKTSNTGNISNVSIENRSDLVHKRPRSRDPDDGRGLISTTAQLPVYTLPCELDEEQVYYKKYRKLFHSAVGELHARRLVDIVAHVAHHSIGISSKVTTDLKVVVIGLHNKDELMKHLLGQTNQQIQRNASFYITVHGLDANNTDYNSIKQQFTNHTNFHLHRTSSDYDTSLRHLTEQATGTAGDRSIDVNHSQTQSNGIKHVLYTIIDVDRQEALIDVLRGMQLWDQPSASERVRGLMFPAIQIKLQKHWAISSPTSSYATDESYQGRGNNITTIIRDLAAAGYEHYLLAAEPMLGLRVSIEFLEAKYSGVADGLGEVHLLCVHRSALVLARQPHGHHQQQLHNNHSNDRQQHNSAHEILIAKTLKKLVAPFRCEPLERHGPGHGHRHHHSSALTSHTALRRHS